MAKVFNLKKLNKITAITIMAVFFSLSFSVKTASASNPVFTIIAGDNTYRFLEQEINEVDGVKSLKCQSSVLNGIYLDTLIKPQDAYLDFTANTSGFNVISETVGKEIDLISLEKDVITALNSNKKSVTAKFSKTYATVNKNDVLKETNLRSRFTTYYSASSENRKFNIALAVEKLNGVKIAPNCEFSFNQTVGARTEENGFKTAKIILNGDFTDGVGGGVCQVSTTLYNSALLAGLKITEQHSHSLQVSYVEPSFDAMVNSNLSDLKFVNTTGANVYILARADGNALAISIYGLKQEERYERVSLVTGEIEPNSIEEVLDYTLPLGTKITKRNAKNGIKSEGYIIVYKGDTRIKNLKIRSDTYNPISSKILVGKAS